MTNIINLLITVITIFGWYIFINDIINTLLYKNLKLGKNIKIQLTVKNQEENIEMIIKKIKNDFEEIKHLEIIDDNSDDKTYEILTKIQKENPNIKIRKIN